MKRIPLTHGLYAEVDDADYNWLNRRKWFADKTRHIFYAANNIRVGKKKRKTERMHRVILGLQPGDKQETDHIDGNGLNNQRDNLRICTRAQNGRYSKKRTVSTSKYKGVSWHRGAGKWQSYAGLNGKRIYLGLFQSEKKAAQAYNQAALKYYGDFALLNTL